MKTISFVSMCLAVSAFADPLEINVDTTLSDMSREQQGQIATLVNKFNVEKFAAKLCHNYIVVITRNEDVATCAQAIKACDVQPENVSCPEPLDVAIAKSALTGKRVVECFAAIATYNQKLPAFNCLSEKSDSNMMIWKQLESSRFPLEVESCIEDLRGEQIGFH